jgi:F0F1-type ATP synthase membrane subunit b/b'
MTTPPDDSFLKAELAEMKELFVKPETDIKRGLARNPWVLLGLLSGALVAVGGLFGQLTSIATQEREEIKREQREIRQEQNEIKGELREYRQRMLQFSALAQEAVNGIRRLEREQYQHYRAAAEARGDTAAVKRLDRKIQAIDGDSKSP